MDTERTVFNFQNVVAPVPRSETFSVEIAETSPAFVEIYKEADTALQLGLSQIAGVGFRKSLEFLIKDYLINFEVKDRPTIEAMFLGKCISDHVSNPNIKSVAKRATWLGNDETHYTRRWEGKGVDDLKALIRLTVNWVEMEVLTKKLETEMPA